MRKAQVAAMLATLFISMPLQAQNRSDFAEALTAAVPKLAMLRTADPAAFDRIVGIYEEGARSGKSRDELVGVARASLTFKPAQFLPAATAQEEQVFFARAITAEAAASHEAFEPYVRRVFASPTTNCSLQRALMERMRKAPNAVALFRRRMAAGPGE